MFNCTCCGTEVTAPYFYKGGVYGWTCIKKVNPNARRNKPKMKAVEVKVLKVKFGEMSTRGDVLVEIDGKKQFTVAFRTYNYDTEVFSETFEFGNYDYFDGKFWALVPK